MSRANKPVRRADVSISKKNVPKAEQPAETAAVKREETKAKKTVKPAKKKNVFARYADLWESVHKPTAKEWFSIFWKVALIVLVLAVFFLGFDYITLEAILFVQSFVDIASTSKTPAIVYATLLVVTGVLTLITILLQRGNSDGLTSMFGSGVEYGGSSISGLASRIGKVSAVLMVLFAVLVMLSPAVFGGGAI